MSEIFNKAKEIAYEMKGYPGIIITKELREKNLKQGDFSISMYIDLSPLANEKMIGMDKGYENREGFDKIMTFSKSNGLKTKVSGDGVLLFGPNGSLEGQVYSSYFIASNAELFEGIGKALGLKKE